MTLSWRRWEADFSSVADTLRQWDRTDPFLRADFERAIEVIRVTPDIGEIIKEDKFATTYVYVHNEYVHTKAAMRILYEHNTTRIVVLAVALA